MGLEYGRRLAMGTALLLACSSQSSSTSTTRPIGYVGLNNVSVILPLPKQKDQVDLLIRPTDVGGKGEMLPEAVQPGPALVMTEERTTTLRALRVVATRIDPCWPNMAETDLKKCQRAFHLIWQPIVPAWEAGATGMAAADAAVHTFHKLTSAEYDKLLLEVTALDATAPVDPKRPLQVHPAIAAEGLGGAYYKAYRALVMRYAGGDNVFEMTFLALRANGQNGLYTGQGWLLGGAAFENGGSFRVSVATTSDNEQHFGNNVNDGTGIENQTEFLGDFTPDAPSTTALLTLVGDSKLAKTAPMADVQKAIDVILKAENPLLNTLESQDCMTCHVGTTARLWTEKNRGIDTSKNVFRYTNDNFPLTLTSESATRSNAIHGMGWYGNHTCISQRTVNDTAAAADFINTNLLRSN
jgi:hypothetical protein